MFRIGSDNASFRKNVVLGGRNRIVFVYLFYDAYVLSTHDASFGRLVLHTPRFDSFTGQKH